MSNVVDKEVKKTRDEEECHHNKAKFYAETEPPQMPANFMLGFHQRAQLFYNPFLCGDEMRSGLVFFGHVLAIGYLFKGFQAGFS